MRKSNLKLLLCFFALPFFGCSSFKEVHFFSDNTPGIPNYYRLKVSGFSFFSSSRYLSGYYDPAAVNQYFNEIKQPEKGRFTVPQIAASVAPDSLLTTTLNKGQFLKSGSHSKLSTIDKERLVLIYSTNSDAVSNQIGLISQNDATMDALALLLYDNQYEEERGVEVKDAVSRSRNSLLIGLGEPLVENLNEATDSQAKVFSSLLQYMNALALELGNTTPFANFEEAEEWLNKNRSGILNSTK